jgi:GNAT superfamily N-acetyltransferase
MQLVRVTDQSSRRYAEAIAILHEAIAPEAQLPEQRFHDLLFSGRYRLFAFAENDEVLGMALVYFSEQLRFAWLDYFAIRSDMRGRGLGSDLFRGIVQMAIEQSPQAHWLLFEVDDEYQDDPQREAVCKRRVEFYRRLGARVLENVPYKFPSAFAEPIRMQLMAYQLRSDARLSPDDLSQIVKEVFSNIHGRGDEDDLLRWFQQNLPENLETS